MSRFHPLRSPDPALTTVAPNPRLPKQVDAGCDTGDASWDQDDTINISEEELPKTIGRFRVIRKVGEGGMGSVYLGHDDRLDRPVAIKVPRLDATRSIETRNRLLREAKLTAGMSHPNLVQVYEVGIWENHCFVASQWAPDGDLSDWIRNNPGPADTAWALQLLECITDVLGHCHQNGIVHLDLKPGNILFDSSSPTQDASACLDGETDFSSPLLADFGLARLVEQGLEETLSSVILGTPMYMSPEQIEGRINEVDKRADVFAVGVLMHELLFGTRPFIGRTAVAVLDRIRNRESSFMPKSVGVPNSLRSICRKCLESNPKDRYKDASEIRDDIRRILNNEPVLVRTPTVATHLSRWTQKTTRIDEAGLLSVWLQGGVLTALILLLVMKELGWADAVPTSMQRLTVDVLSIIAFPTLPNIVVGYLILRKHAWAFWANAAISLGFVGLLTMAIVSQDSPMSLYNGEPLAFFIAHFLLLMLAITLLFAHIVAIPAALRQSQYRLILS